MDAAPADVPRVRALDFMANSHAARTQDAAMVIETEALMARVCRELGKLVTQPHVIDAELYSKILQLAISVGNAHRAHMIALGQQQLDNQLAMRREARRVGAHNHAFFHRHEAGGLQILLALDLNET